MASLAPVCRDISRPIAVKRRRVTSPPLAADEPSHHECDVPPCAGVEALEVRILFTWIGATSGSTNDAAHRYDNPANWAGGVIDDSFAGVTFASDTTLFLNANRTIGASGLNLSYLGGGDLAIRSASGTARTLTLAGDLDASAAGGDVTIGHASAAINIAFTGTRTATVATGQSLTLRNVLSGTGRLVKAGDGVLTLPGTNTYSGGTILNAGQINLNAARAIGTGTFVINGGSIDNTSGGSITLTSNNVQTWGGDFAFLGTSALSMGTGAVTLGANRIVTVGGVGTFSVGGIVSGAGLELTKAGSGALTMSGANTFTGGMNLSAGRLNVNHARAVGTGTLTIGDGTTLDNTSGAAITLTNNNLQTWDGDFTFVGTNSLSLGTGLVTMTGDRVVTVSAGTLTAGGIIDDGGNGYSLTKGGVGALTLAAANTLTGGITLSGGRLNLNHAAALGSGTFTINGGSIDNSSAANITINTANDQVWAGDFTFVGTRTLNLGTGDITLDGDRTVTVTAGTLAVSGKIDDAGLIRRLTKAGAGTLSLGGANTFSGGVTLDAGTLTFANGTLGAGPIEFGGNATLQWAAGNTQDISADLAAIPVGVVATIDTGANSVSFANALSGSGAITKAGTGTLSLSAANAHAGGTTLSAGTLNVNHAGALGSGTFTVSGGTLNNSSAGGLTLASDIAITIAGSFTFTGTRSLNLGEGAVTLVGNRTITASASTLTIGGVIGGAHSLGKAGNGTLTLTNDNTYTGGTSISAGTLNINHAGAIGTGTLTVTGGTLNNTSGGALTLDNAITIAGTLTFAGSNPLEFATGAVTLTGNRTVSTTAGLLTIGGQIGGAYTLTKAGNGTLILSAANVHGGTTLTAGKLDVNHPAALGSGTLTLSGGTIDNTSGGPIALAHDNPQVWSGSFTIANADLIDFGSGNITLSGNRTVTVTAGLFGVGGTIGGTGSLTKAGTGTMTLRAANTYSGGTTLSAGTLRLADASAAGTGTLTLTAGTLANDSGAPMTIDNALALAGNVTLAVDDDLTVAGNVTLTGNRALTVSGGTLALEGNIAGAFSLTKAGAGTLALAGANAYSGGTIVSAGRLAINSSNAIGTGTLTLNGGSIDNTSGGTVTLATNNAMSWAANVSFVGTDDLIFGTGTITLTASRTVTTAAGTLSLGGAIVGAYSLTKAGPGTLVMRGASTFSAGMTVSNGTVQANNTGGSGTGTGAVTVANGATLAGTGRASGAVTIQAGGTLAPGAGGTAIFSTGNLILSAGANLDLTIDGDVAGTDYDALNVTGTVSLANGVLNLSGTRDTHDGTAITLITNDNADAIAGTFAGRAQGSTIELNDVTYTTSYLGGSGNDLVLTSQLEATTIALDPSAGPSVFGESVTFSVLVASGSGHAPTGTVTFMDGATTLGTATLDASGMASFTTSLLDVGSHSISASYGGDASFVASSTALLITQVVGKAATTAGVQSSVSAAVYGETVTLTATVAVVSPGDGSPGGLVTFRSGSTVLGTASLDANGEASIDVASFAVGSHAITVTYAGDDNFQGDTSTTLTQVVTRAATTVSVVSSDDTTVAGGSFTLVATVIVDAPGSGIAGGTVTFKAGSVVLGTATLNGAGIATLNVDGLLVGNHAITAVYSGSTNYAGTTSSVMSQQVSKASTTAVVTTSDNDSAYGHAVTLVATVSVDAPGDGVVSGTVTFRAGTTVLGTATVDPDGTATLAVWNLAIGTHSITASYSGDANFSGDLSSATTQSVHAAATTMTIESNRAHPRFGESVTFTASVGSTSVDGGIPAGLVEFYVDGILRHTARLNAFGRANWTVDALTVGSRSVVAVYGGEPNHTASMSSVFTQSVDRAATSTQMKLANRSTRFGQSATIEVRIVATADGAGTPAGVVTLFDGDTMVGTATLDEHGIAIFTTDRLDVGLRTLRVVYAGSDTFAGSEATPQTLMVNRAETAAELVIAEGQSALGQPVRVTVTVISELVHVPQGRVLLFDGDTLLATADLDEHGDAMFNVSSLDVGVHDLHALYEGSLTLDAAGTPPTRVYIVPTEVPTVARPRIDEVGVWMSAGPASDRDEANGLGELFAAFNDASRPMRVEASPGVAMVQAHLKMTWVIAPSVLVIFSLHDQPAEPATIALASKKVDADRLDDAKRPATQPTNGEAEVSEPAATPAAEEYAEPEAESSNVESDDAKPTTMPNDVSLIGPVTPGLADGAAALGGGLFVGDDRGRGKRRQRMRRRAALAIRPV